MSLAVLNCGAALVVKREVRNAFGWADVMDRAEAPLCRKSLPGVDFEMNTLESSKRL